MAYLLSVHSTRESLFLFISFSPFVYTYVSYSYIYIIAFARKLIYEYLTIGRSNRFCVLSIIFAISSNLLLRHLLEMN